MVPHKSNAHNLTPPRISCYAKGIQGQSEAFLISNRFLFLKKGFFMGCRISMPVLIGQIALLGKKNFLGNSKSESWSQNSGTSVFQCLMIIWQLTVEDRTQGNQETKPFCLYRLTTQLLPPFQASSISFSHRHQTRKQGSYVDKQVWVWEAILGPDASSFWSNERNREPNLMSSAWTSCLLGLVTNGI